MGVSDNPCLQEGLSVSGVVLGMSRCEQVVKVIGEEVRAKTLHGFPQNAIHGGGQRTLDHVEGTMALHKIARAFARLCPNSKRG